MLDLNFVRENLEAVRVALAARNFPADALETFTGLDAERRRVISESDEVNQQRNAASKEIGELMKSGDRDVADARKAEVAELKETQSRLDSLRDQQRLDRCGACSPRSGRALPVRALLAG